MNDATISLVFIALLVASSTTGALVASHVVEGDGNSMRPGLCDGSLVVVDRGASPDAGDVVVAKWRDATLTHRVVGFDGRYVNLTGDNTRSLDYWKVNGADRHVEFTDIEGGEYARPLRRDVVGVVDHVLDDGCGPV